MHDFEQIRAHVASRYRIHANEPYLIGIELSLSHGERRQNIYLSELRDEDGALYLRVSTSITPMTGVDARRALQFNWGQRIGHLAVSELDGVPCLHLCENRPYTSLTPAEIERIMLEVGGLGDRLEHALSAGGDLF